MPETSASYLLFRLNRACFAFDARTVREVLPLPGITAVEETPPYVVGVVNLRGRVVPLIDLNLRFGHPTSPYHPDLTLVVVESDGLQAGVIVSEALDVVEIPPALIEAPPLPESPERVFPPFVLGNARLEEGVVMVLDSRLLLSWTDPAGWLAELLPGAPEEAGPVAEPLPEGEADRLFRERARALLGDTAEADAGEGEAAALRFGEELFALPLGQILEFSAIRQVVPLPNCPAHVVGSLSLHGEVLTVLDVRSFLGLPARPFAPSAVAVVASAAGLRAALLVDAVEGIVPVRTETLAPLPGASEDRRAGLLLGVLPSPEGALTLLDLEPLFADPRLRVGAGEDHVSGALPESAGAPA